MLFVSHNMNAVLNLCSRGIVLEHGEVTFNGTSSAAVVAYADSFKSRREGLVNLRTAPRSNGMRPLIVGAGLRRRTEQEYDIHVNTGDELIIEVHYECGDEPVDVMQIGVNTAAGQRLFTVGTHLSPRAPEMFCGAGAVECRLSRLPLAAGEYDVAIAMTKREPWRDVDCVDAALRFHVSTNDYFGTGLQPGTEQGPIAQHSTWFPMPPPVSRPADAYC